MALGILHAFHQLPPLLGLPTLAGPTQPPRFPVFLNPSSLSHSPSLLRFSLLLFAFAAFLFVLSSGHFLFFSFSLFLFLFLCSLPFLSLVFLSVFPRSLLFPRFCRLLFRFCSFFLCLLSFPFSQFPSLSFSSLSPQSFLFSPFFFCTSLMSLPFSCLVSFSLVSF